MRPKVRPLLLTQHDDRNPAIREVLLVAQVLVGCQKHIKPRVPCCIEKVTVAQRIPTFLRGSPHDMPFQKRPDGHRRTLIEQDSHQRANAGGRSKLLAANSITAFT
jgi:hypothetical protein